MGSSVTFEEMAYDAITNVYLQHYGVKGQKKGSNRWWTPDKKLTQEGRIHYGYGDGRKGGSDNKINDNKPSTNTETSSPNKPTLREQKNQLNKLNEEYSKEWARIVNDWAEKNKDAPFEDLIKVRKDADKKVDDMFGPKFDELRKVDFSDVNREDFMNSNRLFKKHTAKKIDEKAQKENEELKKKLEYRESNEEVDPETGLYLKNKNMSVSEDVKTINHGFGTFDERNSNNCMLCTTTFDMRRRGYDVYAGQSNDGYTEESIKKWYKDPVINDFDSFRVEAARELRDKTGKEPDSWNKIDSLAYNKAFKQLAKQPNNSYGNLTVEYASGGGHSMIYEIKHGVLLIHDAQVGKANIIGGSYLQNYGAPFASITFTRLDNLTPNIENMQKDGVFI